MQDMRRNAAATGRPASEARRVSRKGTARDSKRTAPVNGSKGRLTQRVGNQIQGRKRLSPDERKKKDEKQTRWLNALRIAQVHRATINSGWFYMDEELVPAEVGETFEAADGHTYRVEALVVNGERAVRRIK